MSKFRLLSCLSFFYLLTSAQVVIDEDSSQFFFLEWKGHALFPLADMGKDYGFSPSVGMGMHLKTTTNRTFSASFHYFLGNTVHEKGTDLFGDIYTTNGFIDVNGALSFEQYFLRGMQIHALTGKMISIGHTKKAAHTLWLQAGLGFLWYKTLVTNPENRIPVLTDEFLKGFDKLRSGLSFSQSIGYFIRSRKNVGSRLYIGAEIIEGITQNRRNYSYKTNQPLENDTRVDILLGFTLSYFISLRSHKVEEYQYF